MPLKESGMIDRYSYIKDFSELKKGYHKGVYEFSISEEKTKNR
jgi:hypothetical protein